jgi:glycosyltransferase involved in cell wall biosynthesis
MHANGMKILQVVPALEQGGVERGTVEIAAALSAAGIPNAVASSGGRLVENLKALGAGHFTLPLASKNPLTVAANGSRLAGIVRDGGFTLMHVRSRAPAWSVRRASRITGVPFIATWHGLYGTKPAWLKIPYNRIMLSGSLTIAISECVRNHLLSVYGADPEKIALIHRGADVDKFRPDAVKAGDVAEFRARLGVADGGILVTLPGRLTFWKGQTVLLDAVAAARRAGVTVLFVGSDQGRSDYTASLKDKASRLRDGKRAVFMEHTDDMPLVYAASDVVVSASSAQPEAFGRVIPEAQAMGRIVVGTAHGGACETIADGKTGFLVPPGDPAALASALDRALSMSPAESRRMRDAAVESVRENFSTRAMCEKTLEVYRRVQAI